MRLGRLRTGTIALVTAYAVALQGLLSAFVVPASAMFQADVLCSGQTIDQHGTPAGHEASCVTACAMLGASATLPIPCSTLSALFRHPAPEHVAVTAPVIAPQRGPNTARAPPPNA